MADTPTPSADALAALVAASCELGGLGARQAAREAANGKASRAQVDRGLSQVKAIFARSQAPGLTDSRRGSRRPSRAQM